MNKDKITVTLTYEERVALTNLLQMMTVCGVKLYVEGFKPDLSRLTSIFEKLILPGDVR